MKRQMKATKRIVALVLALVMMATATCIGAFAYDAVPQMKADLYLHFGDSSSTGYAMMTEEEKDAMKPLDFIMNTTLDQRVEGSYPDIIAHYAGIPDGSSRFHKFAREGLATDNLIEMVDPTYYSTGMTDRERATSDLSWKMFTEDRLEGKTVTKTRLQKEYQNCVKNSKGKKVLITINIGANDILSGPVMDLVCGALDATKGNLSYQKDVYNMIDQFADQYAEGDLQKAMKTLLKIGAVVGYTPEMLYRAVEDEATGISKFHPKWDKLISTIYNDFTNAGADLELVAVGYYDATRKLKLVEADSYHIGRNMGIFSALLEDYVAKKSPYRDCYKYAYIREMDLPTWPNMAVWAFRGTNFIKDFMYCSHPTAKGHQYVADAVKRVILNGHSDEVPDLLMEALR